VGDNQNDIPMLEKSAIPFAPANCAQEVKDWGARVLCSCEDGVIGDIVEILDKRYPNERLCRTWAEQEK
jgi:hydroxymethylpyrimidine pyrophosphatase-like HAD family hydrolase